MVLVAWVYLYKRLPNWWQFPCIFLHDIGHWGKNYLDNHEEKMQHAVLGAKVGKALFGQRAYDFLIGHNPYGDTPKSLLHNPDKYSWIIAPVWWMVSNTWFEPKLIRKGSTRRESALMFKDAMRQNWQNGFEKRGHDIYLEQWGQSQD
jgi:hypothetical protein